MTAKQAFLKVSLPKDHHKEDFYIGTRGYSE
jgi:hypothetical protein